MHVETPPPRGAEDRTALQPSGAVRCARQNRFSEELRQIRKRLSAAPNEGQAYRDLNGELVRPPLLEKSGPHVLRCARSRTIGQRRRNPRGHARQSSRPHGALKALEPCTLS
jgi:hypothetical protein